MKSKFGLSHIVLTTPKSSPEKITLTLVEMEQLTETEKAFSKNQISCLKGKTCNGGRRVCESFKTDMDKLNMILYRYRNSTDDKDTETELKKTE